MNFKKYHVSKNLIDYKTIFSQFIDSNGDISGRVSQIRKWVNFTAEDIGKTLTLSFYAKSVSASYIRVQAQINGEYVTGNNINAGSSGYSEITITPTSTDDVWRITYGNDSEIVVNQVMLEESSTRTAYEPYSSEVWHDIPHYIHKTDADILTLPQTIYGDGTNATITLKGNEEHTGTPTPQNPVMPNGTGERTSNLWNGATIEAGRLDNGVVGYKSDTTNITFSDDILSFTTTANYRGVVSDLMPIDNEMRISYTLSSLMTKKVAWYAADTTFLSQTTYSTSDYRNGKLLSPPENAKFFRISFEPPTAGTYTIAYPKLNTGSTALPYEPYGIKIPISSANTTTPVYLGEAQTTRKIRKLVLTGEETGWRITGSGRMALAFSSAANPLRNIACICTHYKGTSASAYGNLASNECTVSTMNGNNHEFGVYDTDYSVLADFKTYLQQQYAAGTPVTVWYVLATEKTAVVNEPLMKIGDYADSLTTSIPTTDGANSLSVDTTVQPSEVTANYHGWHPVSNVHEAENGQWD